MKTNPFNLETGGRMARDIWECGDGLPPSPTAKCGGVTKHGLVRALPKQLLYFCFLFAAVCMRTSGQSYSVDWYKIAGGGGTSTNGQYALSGTIGQPDAGGPLTGGNYSLTGGFWSLISVVQTAGAPTLNISRSGNLVTIYWQDVSGWSLQQNNNLALTNGWTATGSWTTSNGTNYLNLTTSAGNWFFRLQHQ